MKNAKLEGNILFLGPFLTAYFIKTSQESIVDLSVYYIFSNILLAVGSFIVASIIKNKFRIRWWSCENISNIKIWWKQDKNQYGNDWSIER